VSSLTWGRKQIQFPKRCVFHLFRKNPDDGQSPKTQYLCGSVQFRHSSVGIRKLAVSIEDSSGEQLSEKTKKRDGLVRSHCLERRYTSASVITAEWYNCLQRRQINHHRLSSVHINYLSRIPEHVTSWRPRRNKPCIHVTIYYIVTCLGAWDTRFGLVIGFIINPQIIATINS
jgi:hypothetical protein